MLSLIQGLLTLVVGAWESFKKKPEPEKMPEPIDLDKVRKAKKDLGLKDE